MEIVEGPLYYVTTCPQCGKEDTLVCRYHRGTAYVEEASNWNTGCEDCMKEDKEEVRELWDEYYGGML